MPGRTMDSSELLMTNWIDFLHSGELGHAGPAHPAMQTGSVPEIDSSLAWAIGTAGRPSDLDAAFGIDAPGRKPEGHHRHLTW